MVCVLGVVERVRVRGELDLEGSAGKKKGRVLVCWIHSLNSSSGILHGTQFLIRTFPAS